ncbi:hypothetical protein [Thiolapillus sp.]
MKNKVNIIIVLLIGVAFAAGIAFENNRIVEKADLTAAVLMAKSGRDLITYSKNIHSEYIALLEENDYEELKIKISRNFDNLVYMESTAYNPCSEAECSKELLEYLAEEDNESNKSN